MQKLISEIKRLYLMDGQRYREHDDAAPMPLSTSVFEQHLLGVRAISLELVTDQGLTRALVANMVQGVATGYALALDLHGVG